MRNIAAAIQFRMTAMVKVIGLLMRGRVARKDCFLRELAEKKLGLLGQFSENWAWHCLNRSHEEFERPRRVDGVLALA